MRFIGTFIFSATFFDLIIRLLKSKGIMLNIIIMLIALVLYKINYNVLDSFKGSVIKTCIEKCLGTELNLYGSVEKFDARTKNFCAVIFGALAGIISGFISPLYSVVFVCALWFVFMVLYKVEFGVFVTVFLAPIIPTMAVVGLCFLCLVSLFIKAITSDEFQWRLDGIGLLLIGMIVVYLFSSVLSFASYKSVKIWAVYFMFMMFYFVIINTVKTKKQFCDLLTIFVISGTLVCLYGILQYIFGWNITQAWLDEEMFEGIKMRIYSTLQNPNVLGEYILLTLPVCISLMWTKKGILPKLIYAMMSGIMFLALILTFSRGCWIGIMIAAAVFITFVAGKLWELLLIVLPVLPMILPESIITRFTSIGDMKDSSTSYRVYIWMGTLLMLKDFWVSGIGPGTEAFTQVYPFYSYNAVVAPHSHNLFLQILVESGVIGIGVFLILMVMFIKKLAQGYQAEGKGGSVSTILAALGAAVIGFLVQGLFDNCFYNYRVFMIFWVVIAIGMCGVYIAKNAPKEEKTDD